MTNLPLAWLIADYALGLVMWTLIARFAMGLFLLSETGWFFARAINRATDLLIWLFRPVTPGFLIPPMVPLYVAWFFFMVRFYVLPPLMGFGAMGVLSFPLESDIARLLYAVFGGG